MVSSNCNVELKPAFCGFDDYIRTQVLSVETDFFFFVIT